MCSVFRKYEHMQIEELCRICLNKKDEMLLMSECGLINMLLECASVRVPEEDGPCLVCSYCASEVNHWYAFRQQVIRSFEIAECLIKQKASPSKLQEPGNPEALTTWVIDQELRRSESNEVDFSDGPLIDSQCEQTCLDKNESSQKSKKYECSKCGKCFRQSQTLTDHVRRHYDSRNYACEICGKKFYKLFNVTEHMRMHTGERPFKCEYCARTFTSAPAPQPRQKGEQRFVCEVCSKNFVDGYQLKIHMRTHTGEKPFPCHQCDKAFAMLGQLKSHVKYKHTLEKDFICNICGRAFTAKHTLDEHLRTHTGRNESRDTCAEPAGRSASPRRS